MENESNNIGRVYDLLPAGAWHDGAAFAPYHTQSTCLSGNCASGAATGGMDDRFDMILPTLNLGTGQGLAVIAGTCRACGNDGLHFNHAITDPPVIPEGAEYATALQLASDHLPVRMDLQVPARIQVDPSFAFDPAIIGAPPQSRSLMVENPAVAPADSLNCTFTPPAGFGAPASLAVPAETTLPAVITMACETSGSKSGDLTISSDAPDDPVTLIALSGTVLDHAAASLDSTGVVLAGSVDFGNHDPGAFPLQAVRVHNFGYDPLQARLLVSDAEFNGGGGRFYIPGGFESVLIAGQSHEFTLAFNDVGADQDSTYTATLVFSSADEPLPGAIAQPDLLVSLRAHVGGIDSIGDGQRIAATRLYDPFPNPLTGTMTVRLDLAQAARTSLDVFDASGRLVATLGEGTFGPGRYTFTWDGRSVGTPVGSGVYFLRFNAPGLRIQSARLAVVR